MAQWMRVMLCELTRISSHLIWLGTHALDIGAMTVYFYCFREREEILKIFEMFSGQRMMTSYIRIGGLALEPPRGWHKVVSRVVERLASGIDEYQNLLASNPIWVNRTKGIGMLPVDVMMDLGGHRGRHFSKEVRHGANQLPNLAKLATEATYH